MRKGFTILLATTALLAATGCDEIEIDFDGFDGFGIPVFYDPHPYYHSDVVVVDDYYYDDYYYDDYFYWW